MVLKDGIFRMVFYQRGKVESAFLTNLCVL